ncbi:AAA domain-containing protein [Lunatibacter salilacus]|uniref:AAA domain-containing protein n=1 Tax=Lunatibacter salilacus TaxID=2483804 RepID=UPI00131C98F2|nr:AAA domain-containing protein [Lunatibacter salilacus]
MLQDILQVYKNRLVDLSSNNRSIFLPKLIHQQMIDLKDFHFLNNHPSFFYITELLGRKRNIPLIQLNDARDKNVNQLSQRLKRLQQNVKFAEEETGEKNLFVGWPFVEGKLLNDQLIRCPLLFFPISLVLEENAWYLRKNPGELPFLNPSFLLAYGQAQGKPLDKVWMEQSLEDFSKDPRGFRTDLYHHLQKGLVLNFNREIYQDKLEIFPEQNRAFFDDAFSTGILKLNPYAVLGQFPQKSSFLMDDYTQLIAENSHQDLDGLLESWFSTFDASPRTTKEDNLYTTLPLDASQEEVIKNVKTGGSCVVQGPPGTGKSQLICNLVTDFISRGKKVLVISQKRVALDVVFERLAQQGFANFAGLVHDFRGDRKELYKKIAHQISSLESYQELNRSVDAIQLERNFSQNCRIIERNIDFFSEYKEALFDVYDCGAPIKQLYVSSSADEKNIDLNQYYKSYRFGELDSFFRDFEVFHDYYKTYDYQSSFWFHRVNFSSFESSALSGFRDILHEIAQVKESAESKLKKWLAQDFEFNVIFQSFENREKLAQLKEIITDESVFNTLKELMPLGKNSLDVLWLENKVDTIAKLFQSIGIEWYTADEDVEPTFKRAIQLLELLDSWVGKIKLKSNPKKYWDILNLLDLNQLKKNKEGVAFLIEKLENRLNLNHQYTLLKQKEWITLPEKPFEWNRFKSMADKLTLAIRARFLMADLGVLVSYIYRQPMSFAHFHGTLDELIRLNEWGLEHLPKWRIYLTDIQLKHLLGAPDEEKLFPVLATLPKDFEALVRFDTLKMNLREADRKVMEKLMDNFPELDFESQKQIFLANLKISWIEHLEAKYPVLKELSGPQMRGVITEFQEAVEEKSKISRFIVEMRLREEVCSKLENNRLGNLITYRDLNHQVTKKSQLWPVKKLVSNHAKEIFKLIPCWLASPETAAALFPLEPYFDLVIFDEASQCYFERALPVMRRGVQVVVAGDSHQLQPSDLYKVRIETEEEAPELELESLLEMASRYFPTFQLKTHYRSSYLPLIHFSNIHFYNNSLSMLPDMQSLNEEIISLRRIKMNGVWEKQTNREEAEEVIHQVKLLREKFPQESVGVITFNYFQMVLVMELLDAEGLLSHQEKIKVRNIENVQGDEFDRVIFTVGYAPNLSGKFTANFGLLSKKGGENRLNVAVTRARKEIILITSLSSADFKDSLMGNRGIKMLRDYIAFVEDVEAGKNIDVKPVIPSDFEDTWSLKNQLSGEYGNHMVGENAYYRVMDLEVRESGKLSSALLTDDQRFYSANNAKESLVYHPKLLSAKNWKPIYVFSRQYWLDRADLLQTKLGKKDSHLPK